MQPAEPKHSFLSVFTVNLIDDGSGSAQIFAAVVVVSPGTRGSVGPPPAGGPVPLAG